MPAHQPALKAEPKPARADRIAPALLAWYDRHHRDLPWRVTPSALRSGARPDPYRVWLSEIMLQQTTVETVKPYFRDFVARWPTVHALAASETEDVMKAWAGLGYYSRARNLKKCADAVAALPGGEFPDTHDGLLALPGIGPYTAAAIASIAFDRRAAVVDGNVERVMTRLERIDTPLPAAKPLVRAAVEAILPSDRPGDFAQATMDLGATICTPRKPACILCPVKEDCRALAAGDPEFYPIKAKKKDRPARVGAAFVAVRGDGAVLLRKRPDTGLLGGMSEVPMSAWTARQDGATGIDAAPFPADWAAAGTVGHIFTHFSLELAVYRAEGVTRLAPDGWWWSMPYDLPREALPTVIKRAIEAALPGATLKRP